MTAATHVATTQEEDAKLPPNILANSRKLANEDGIECVFMVDDASGEILGGEMVDTIRDLYAPFQLVKVDLAGEQVWTGIAADDWKPLEDDES